MTKRIFIRYDTSEGNSWADCLECLNNDTTKAQKDISTVSEYSQHVNYYYKADNKMRLFKSQWDDNTKPYLSIGIPSRTKNQSVAVNFVNFDIIATETAKTKYNSIHFAYLHNDKENPRSLDIVEKSGYFARNNITGKMEDLQTGLEVQGDSVTMSIWYTVFKIGADEMYYLVVNPNLVSVTEDLDGSFKDETYYLINTHDGNLKESVFTPSFDGCITVGDNILYTSGDTVTIDVLGNSLMHGFAGKRLSYAELPFLPVSLDSTFKVDRVENKLIVQVDKNVGYVKYSFVTNTSLDYFLSGKEKLEYSFVIIKE